jgi:hypothetical protein
MRVGPEGRQRLLRPLRRDIEERRPTNRGSKMSEFQHWLNMHNPSKTGLYTDMDMSAAWAAGRGSMQLGSHLTPEETARRFHDAYEEFAPLFGYITREDTRKFDPESANGRLMIAVVRNVLIEQVKEAAINNRDA